MALNIGDPGATTGMTKDIYDKLDQILRPNVPAENLADAQKVWRDLAFAIATGVVTHILKSAEITNVSVTGNVTLPVAGSNAAGQLTLSQSGATGKVN